MVFFIIFILVLFFGIIFIGIVVYAITEPNNQTNKQIVEEVTVVVKTPCNNDLPNNGNININLDDDNTNQHIVCPNRNRCDKVESNQYFKYNDIDYNNGFNNDIVDYNEDQYPLYSGRFKH